MFEQEQQTNSLIMAGLILLVYEAMVIICFYFLAPIVMIILYSIFNSQVTLDYGGAVYASEFYVITVMMFAIAFLIPLVWFILWVFRTESGYQIIRVR
jgi:Sec-independent protein secretion pathway component TatC